MDPAPEPSTPPAAPGPSGRPASRTSGLRLAVIAGVAALAGALLAFLALTVAGRTGSASLTAAGPGSSGDRLPHGQIVLLAGTPHYWVADENGLLHWPADTRALAGRYVRWDAVREVSLAELQRLPRGEPWLTSPAAFVRGRDRTLYLVRWDTGMRWPVPLRLPPLQELALFGLTAPVIDAATQDQDTWERLNDISIDDAAIPFTRIDQAAASAAAVPASSPAPNATRVPGASPTAGGAATPAAGGALPYGWRTGVYSGNGIQEFPSDTYPVSFTFSALRPDPHLGIVAGTVSYPSFPCGGPVGVLSITADRLELTERFTSGLERCTDQGRVTLERRSDTRVFYTWALPSGSGSRTVVTGFLFREGA